MSRKRNSPFTQLREPYKVLTSANELLRFLAPPRRSNLVENMAYEPSSFASRLKPLKFRVEDTKFRNFSFSQTHLSHIEFQNCDFEDCLFVGSLIEKCTFRSCSFSNCNFFRCDVENCFVNPKSFKNCVDRYIDPNIGVSLYRELLQNSRQLAQPEFAREAQFQLKRWTRFQKQKEVKDGKKGFLRKFKDYVGISLSLVSEVTAGYGLRLTRFSATSIGFVFATSVLNYCFRSPFGLMLNETPVDSFVEAFYFSVIVVTSLGFGDITPTTSLGQVVVSLEAVGGFFMFAVLASMLYRRFAG